MHPDPSLTNTNFGTVFSSPYMRFNQALRRSSNASSSFSMQEKPMFLLLAP